MFPIIVTTSLSATALGLLVAMLVHTDSQVSDYGNVVVITKAGISGCFMLRDTLPELMRLVSKSTQHAWALIGYQEILTENSPSLAIVAEPCGVLLLFFLLGCLFFCRVD